MFTPRLSLSQVDEKSPVSRHFLSATSTSLTVTSLYCRFSSAVYLLFSVFIYASPRRHRRLHPPTSVYSGSLHSPRRLIRQRFLPHSVSGSPAAMVVLFMRHSCLLIPR
ncbi:uncharacterized protein BDW70DRAFT_4102 [Aspergillus foveolatus]|uniref:uncharacterized protein n=1 Tax=Aspergillus foveolatus TaxID=210207 RepID=UPI003CCD267F